MNPFALSSARSAPACYTCLNATILKRGTAHMYEGRVGRLTEVSEKTGSWDKISFAIILSQQF